MIKPNLAFLSIIFLFFSPAIFGQQKMAYYRMSGRMGSHSDVVGNFQRSGSSMEGNYSYVLYVNDSMKQLSHIVKLHGNIDKHNYLVLRLLQGGDSTLTGLFTDHRFTGSWQGQDSTLLPFVLAENYPAGSIPMNVFYLHSDKDFVPKAKGTPSAEIELILLYPKSTPSISQAVSDSVKKFIQKRFFGQFKPGQLPTILLRKSEQNFYDRFSEMNSHWITNHKLGFNMDKKEQVSVIFNSNNLLCLQYKKRGYAGRGNPMDHISYDIIDLRNGERLCFRNIFKPGTKATLDSLINKKIREINGLSGRASLKNIGFFYNRIPISREMAFSGNGIELIYNAYDIALPALGIQKIFLPFSEIGAYIKPTSLLYPLSR